MPHISKPRNNSIDIARGIGALMVIVAHHPVSVSSWGIPIFWVFAVNMPLFFVLSGMIYRSSGAREYTEKKFTSLMRPYLGYSFLSLIFLAPVLGGYGLRTALVDIGWGVGFNSPLWFLPTLFLSGLVFNALVNVYPKWGSWWPMMIGAVGILVLYPFHKIAFGKQLNLHLPFGIDLIGLGVFFLGLGHLLMRRSYIQSKLLALLLIPQIGLVYLLPVHFDMSSRTFEFLAVSVVSAVMGVLGLLGIAECISKYNIIVLKRLLGYVGANSLAIYLFHYPFQMMYWKFLGIYQNDYSPFLLMLIADTLTVLTSLLVGSRLRFLPITKVSSPVSAASSHR